MKKILAASFLLTAAAVLMAAGLHAADPEPPPLTVARLVVATGIQDRLPTGVEEIFPVSAGKLYLFLEATNIGVDTDVVFVWFYGEREVHRYTLPVKAGALWRTWTECALMGRRGEWKGEVLVGEKSLQAVSFRVE